MRRRIQNTVLTEEEMRIGSNAKTMWAEEE